MLYTSDLHQMLSSLSHVSLPQNRFALLCRVKTLERSCRTARCKIRVLWSRWLSCSREWAVQSLSCWFKHGFRISYTCSTPKEGFDVTALNISQCHCTAFEGEGASSSAKWDFSIFTAVTQIYTLSDHLHTHTNTNLLTYHTPIHPTCT